MLDNPLSGDGGRHHDVVRGWFLFVVGLVRRTSGPFIHLDLEWQSTWRPAIYLLASLGQPSRFLPPYRPSVLAPAGGYSFFGIFEPWRHIHYNLMGSVGEASPST